MRSYTLHSLHMYKLNLIQIAQNEQEKEKDRPQIYVMNLKMEQNLYWKSSQFGAANDAFRLLLLVSKTLLRSIFCEVLVALSLSCNKLLKDITKRDKIKCKRDHWRIKGEGCGVATPHPLIGKFYPKMSFLVIFRAVYNPFLNQMMDKSSHNRLQPPPPFLKISRSAYGETFKGFIK